MLKLLVHQRFEIISKQFENRIALRMYDESLSYKQLNQLANKYAHFYLKMGIIPNDIIGIGLERSFDQIASIIGALKVGAAYLPLDSSYPKDRLVYMLENSKAKLLITEKSFEKVYENVDQVQKIFIENLDINTYRDDNLSIDTTKFDNLYVIYTSGSTGLPKGILMGHSPLANLIEWQNSETNLKDNSITLQFTPVSFDVHFQEIFSTLTLGGELVLINENDRLNSIKLIEHINKYNVNRLYIPVVTLNLISETAIKYNLKCLSLREVTTAGEQLKITDSIRKFGEICNGKLSLFNHYGPSESHVVTSEQLGNDFKKWDALPKIGKAISNIELFVLDSNENDSIEGELWIGGICLATGYLNLPEATKEKFINHKKYGRIYKTGDLVRQEGNTFEYLGRLDNQVKIRGYRIETNEIEINLAKIKNNSKWCVRAHRLENGNLCLVAYFTNKEIDLFKLKEKLKTILPEYMLPNFYVHINELPVTPSGKIDYKNLPAPELKRPNLINEYVGPSNEIEKILVNIWEEHLLIEGIGISDSFFELGGTSLIAIKVLNEINIKLNLNISIAEFFQNPNIAKFVKSINQFEHENITDIEYEKIGINNNEEIAIIGMAGEFPDSNSIEEFWDNILDKKNCILPFDKSLTSPIVSDEDRSNSNYVLVSGEFPSKKYFDHRFFGITPREAELMDPQQRKFLEICYLALENANIKFHENNNIGVFAGCGNSLYRLALNSNEQKVRDFGEFNTMLGLEKDYIATRVSYKLNLKGPALSIHTGCSTSLVSIVQAVKSLRLNDCSIAIAGGISISGLEHVGHQYIEGGILSKDGKCRPFDQHSTGTVFTDGGGAVVLKRLSDAIKDKDNILATIVGVGLNNDGSDKVSFTAPSLNGHIEAIKKALKDGNIKPDQIKYVEAHGTATPVGDPIEVSALSKVYSGDTLKYIGSVKGNIGHLTAAAGVAGLIKNILILKNQIIPGIANFEKVNDLIDSTKLNFHFPKTNILNEKIEYAALSSLGVGGTNAHIILKKYENVQMPERINTYPLIINLSAKSKKSLEMMVEELKFKLNKCRAKLPQIAFTLNEYRNDFSEKYSCLVSSEQIINECFYSDSDKKKLVFAFPGQGSQFVSMGKEFYESIPLFRFNLDLVLNELERNLDFNLKDLMFYADENSLKNTEVSQPAIFAFQYALGKTFIDLGIYPDLMIGHSIGEFAILALKNVISLSEASFLVTERAKLMKSMPAGSMLQIISNLEDAKVLAKKFDLDIAAINGRSSIVLSGKDENIETLIQYLKLNDIAAIKLKTSHAFHSKMMLPAAEMFEDKVKKIMLNKVDGIIPTSDSKYSFFEYEYWVNHLVNGVNFLRGIQSIPEKSYVVELGKNNILNALIKKEILHSDQKEVISTVLIDGKKIIESFYLKLIEFQKIKGKKINSFVFYAKEDQEKISSVSYKFEKNIHWLNIKNNHHKIGKIMSTSSNDLIKNDLISIFEKTSGIDVNSFATNTSFIEMGMDSLFLTQVATKLKKDLGLAISFRQLLEEYTSIDDLTTYVDSLGLDRYKKKMPSTNSTDIAENKTNPIEIVPDEVTQKEKINSQHLLESKINHTIPDRMVNNFTSNIFLENLIVEQMKLMNRQIDLVSGKGGSGYGSSEKVNSFDINTSPKINQAQPMIEVKKELDNSVNKVKLPPKESFGAQARIKTEKTELFSTETQSKIEKFRNEYNEKTKLSKKFAQDNRYNHADPRVVTGFKPESKEFVYPMVINKSKLQKLWDIDGNQYVDMTCGFGSNFFGNGNEKIKKYVLQQIEEGIELGPQHPLVSDVSKLINELTLNERSAFCNTGSEAVLGAMRIARTVTGREKIIVFSGSYHGINDEVIIRGSKNLKSYPAAAGINQESVENMIVLDYGTDESLDYIRKNAHEAAAVLVEPVQSRRSDFRPKDFLKAVREITLQTETCLIFDEIITGFRIHPRGAQGYYDISADLCTYGKIVGGGMPIGIISGKSKFMDALDGGHWQYGDSSTPTVGVTYFAGTFVRHPLALAAAKGALEIIKEQGVQGLKKLNEKADNFASKIDQMFKDYDLPIKMDNFGALMKPKWTKEISGGDLFFAAMRMNGIHVYDGFPWFVNLAHTDEELNFVIEGIHKSILKMIDIGIFENKNKIEIKLDPKIFDKKGPPVVGAKIGRDEFGNPAWFVEDSNIPGKYKKV